MPRIKWFDSAHEKYVWTGPNFPYLFSQHLRRRFLDFWIPVLEVRSMKIIINVVTWNYSPACSGMLRGGLQADTSHLLPVHCPLFFWKIVGIEHLPLQAAILVSSVPDKVWGWVSNLRWEGTVSKEVIFLAPPPLLFTFETKMATRSGKLWGEHSVSYPG